MIKQDGLKKLEQIRKVSSETLGKAETDLRNMAKIAEEGPAVIESIDQQFEVATHLTKKDISLLFVAIGLQIARWAVLSEIRPLALDYKSELTPREDRLTHDEGDQFSESAKEAQKANKRKQGLIDQYNINSNDAKQDYSDIGYRTVQQILFRPVPYDATDSTEGVMLEKLLTLGFSGTTHRALTLGHDPVWGWLFGPINILTRSITFRSAALATFPVTEKYNKITMPQTNIIIQCQHAIYSIEEDKNRLVASVVKQALHFTADKYTKEGLPLPFISAEKAQQLVEQNWNSAEAEKWIKKAVHTFTHDTGTIAIQFALSYLINEIIRIIHFLLCSDESTEQQLLEVRTRKIISLSNIIASGSNVIYAAVRGYISGNALEGAKVLDIGGIIETTHRIITDSKFINEIKMEYIKTNWQNHVEKELLK